MRFTFIAAKKAEHTVTILCRCVVRDGAVASMRGRPAPNPCHARDDRRLKVLVHTDRFAESSALHYGSAAILFHR